MPLLFASLLVAAAAPAQTAAEPADPVAIVDAAARERGDLSEVLVLGTAHLSALPEDFDRSRFAPLIDRLADWQPEAIAIENLDGPQCDYLRAYAHAYPETAENYCPDPEPARAALGLSGPEADRELRTVLSDSAVERAPAQRRRLAALFLAVGEPDSALVQWLRLPETERHAEGPLTAKLAAQLDKRLSRRNESSLIAAHLAARLGHERVYPVDDHTGDIATGPIEDEDLYAREIRAAWDNPATAERHAASEAWNKQLEAGTLSVLEWYRLMNRNSEARLAMRSDFAAAAGARHPGNTGRKYLAYWETRNLRMVANLRQVIGAGRRVLAIVGSSHKPYYERYLGMTSDVELVDTEAVLAGEAGD
ncbi:hypothetical protein K3181_11080 [Qipengyuania sp. YG27]|uniref:TraB/GumN family protein n=1 Tax=Qipengyuania mesophila TaxID=2867246 RepID=A0ABS7JWE7_9SPHN|nr:DUF5694 domain-containing protein [Qipengyuania mesophila]MBX7501985.1 hypothetical protein [Qipengyuania mesophila]